MDGRTVLVTGATSGIGLVTAGVLGGAGATVLVHSRSMTRAAETAESMRHGGGRFLAVAADLGSLAGVSQLTAQVRQAAPGGLHVLVNNAGAAFRRRALSPEGAERTIAVNHLAVAALTTALLGALRDAAASTGRPSRVVNLSSALEKRGDPDLPDWAYPQRFSQWQAYCDSKLISLAYGYWLAAELVGSGVTVNAADPGNVATSFGRNAGGVFQMIQSLGRPLLSAPGEGARTGVRLAGDPALDGVTGGYYRAAKPATSSAVSRDPAFRDLVRRRTAAILDTTPRP
jgi:NAD(P)-dependent dehydrogenase (short-subunit alcohol dehydrogenase family)